MRFVREGLLACVAVYAGSIASAQITEPQRLNFNVEWRLIRAGTVVIEARNGEGRVKLDSAGLVSTLFKVDDTYTVNSDPGLCATSSLLDAHEGKRHRETRITFDRSQNKATFVLKDMLKNAVLRSEQIEIPNCVHDVLGALLTLRTRRLDLGQSAQIPVSDGRRVASVKVDAQEKEDVETPAGTFKTVRYEAGLMNGIVYARSGRVFLWLTDDARRLPVQIRVRLSFPIGTITLSLTKEERL